MKRVVTRTAIGVAVALALLAVYGMAIEPRLRLDEPHIPIAIPGLGEDLEGATVAVLADLQVGMWWANHGMIARIAERIVDLDPDAVLVAGDFVYGHSPDPAVQVDTVMDLLSPVFEHDVPVFTVLGNHDYAADAVEPLTEALELHGVELLHNRAARVGLTSTASTDLHVVGLGAHRPNEARPDEAFDEVPTGAPRIVMMHNPATYPKIAANRAPLAVAGHTHCGQIALPGTPAWSYMQLRADERIVVDGFAPVDYGAEGNLLFVTCGVGFSLLPMRIWAPPQLAVFELVAEPPSPSSE